MSRYLKNKYKVILFIIFIVALIIRIAGVYPGYPMNHPDEGTISLSALRITFGFDYMPVGYYYGQLLPIIFAFINWVFIMPVFISYIYPLEFLISEILYNQPPLFIRCLLTNETMQYCLTTQHKMFWDYIARYETAILSSFVVIFIYSVGKQLFNKNIGIIAAVLTAINFRHVLSSVFSLADAPASVFALISILLSLNIFKKGNFKSYILAGVGVALALSTKYFIYTIPALLICHIKNIWDNYDRKVISLFLSKKILIALFTTIVVFFAINPHLIIDNQRALYQLKINASRYGLHTTSLKTYFSYVSLYQLYYLYKDVFGVLNYFLIVTGILIGFIKKPLGTVICLSVILPVLLFLLFRSTPVRNYTAIIPLLLYFPAVSTYYFSTLIRKLLIKINFRPNILILYIILTFTVGYINIKNSLSLVGDLSKSHNSEMLTTWILKNIPEGDIVFPSYGAHLPSLYTSNGIIWDPISASYTSLSELLSKKTQWVVISSDSGDHINNLRWIPYNKIVKQIFFDDQKLEAFIRDTYSNLVTEELYRYSIAEFGKNSNLSPEPAYFVSKLPLGQFEKTLNKSIPHVYNGHSKDSNITLTYQGICPSVNEFFITNNFEIFRFDANPNKLYTVNGLSKFSTSNTTEFVKDGYLKLDFYNHENILLSSHVSELTDNNNLWNNQLIYGIAPETAEYGKISFQIDYCQNNGEFSIKNIKVNESIESMSEITNNYKNLNKIIPLKFLENGSF